MARENKLGHFRIHIGVMDRRGMLDLSSYQDRSQLAAFTIASTFSWVMSPWTTSIRWSVFSATSWPRLSEDSGKDADNRSGELAWYGDDDLYDGLNFPEPPSGEQHVRHVDFMGAGRRDNNVARTKA